MSLNICIDCKKAYGDCSWTRVNPITGRVMFIPVDGWDATPTFKSNPRDNSYEIRSCPLFEKDDDRDTEDPLADERQRMVAKWKADGICTRCGKRKARQGLLACEVCAERMRNYKRNHSTSR